MITRKEYMNHYTFRDGETREQHDIRCAAAHRAYYGQFVNVCTMSQVASFIGKDKLLSSTDPHLNDIPLVLWDHVSNCLYMNVSFKSVGDFVTLAGLVCVAKEAAHQWIESQA
jgi:hypothetical protein